MYVSKYHYSRGRKMINFEKMVDSKYKKYLELNKNGSIQDFISKYDEEVTEIIYNKYGNSVSKYLLDFLNKYFYDLKLIYYIVATNNVLGRGEIVIPDFFYSPFDFIDTMVYLVVSGIYNDIKN